MRNSSPLDEFDRRILEQMQRDARTPMPVLAAKVGLSAPACYRRLRQLRRDGVILREAAVVAPHSLGWPLSMIVLVRFANEGPRTADDLMRRFETEETVIEAWQITGEHDFVVRMVAGDMMGYDALTRRLFVENDAVAGFQTLVVFRQTKGAAAVPIRPSVSR